jgi:hypothetical protein
VPKGLSVTYRQRPPGPRRATSVAVPSTCTARPSRPLPARSVDGPVDDQQRHVPAAVHVPRTDRDGTPSCCRRPFAACSSGPVAALPSCGTSTVATALTASCARPCPCCRTRSCSTGWPSSARSESSTATAAQAGHHACATPSPRAATASAPSSRPCGIGARRRQHEQRCWKSCLRARLRSLTDSCRRVCRAWSTAGMLPGRFSRGRRRARRRGSRRAWRRSAIHEGR